MERLKEGKGLRTMIDLVKRFFRKNVENRVAEHLERRCQNIQVATCAVLLEIIIINVIKTRWYDNQQLETRNAQSISLIIDF